MYILDADFTLFEIEQTLENELRVEDTGLRTIGDMKFTYEDYMYLTLKLKGLTKYLTKVEVLDKYKLSIVTAMVFSLRYDEVGDETLIDQMRGVMKRLQQHQVRYCIQSLSTTFYELGIHTYGITMDNMNDLFEVIMLHAGLSPSMYNHLFQLMDNYYNQSDICLFNESKLEDDLVRSIQQLYAPFQVTRAHQFVSTLTDMFQACRIKHYSLERLLSDFPNVSKNLIQACYMWCVKYDHSVNRLLNIR